MSQPAMPAITSRHNPLIRRVRALAEHPATEPDTVLLDGGHLVEAALDAGTPIEVALFGESCVRAGAKHAGLAARLDQAGVQRVTVPDRLAATISPTTSPQGVIAVARVHGVSVDALGQGTNPLLVVLVDVQDPGNLGAVLRTAEACGASGAVVTGHSAHPFGWKAVRGSMGAALRLPVAITEALEPVLEALHGRGFRLVATVPRGGTPLDQVSWAGAIGLLLGAEGAGLPDSALLACDDRVSIPMAAPVNSLNVAAAAAIQLYAARRWAR